jgi:hypothetical protein
MMRDAVRSIRLASSILVLIVAGSALTPPRLAANSAGCSAGGGCNECDDSDGCADVARGRPYRLTKLASKRVRLCAKRIDQPIAERFGYCMQYSVDIYAVEGVYKRKNGQRDRYGLCSRVNCKAGKQGNFECPNYRENPIVGEKRR